MNAAPDLGTQSRLVLTAHPLQRIGAYALAALVDCDRPEDLAPEDFNDAVEQIDGHAIQAALLRDSKAINGFWLKCSLSLFPNSPMNHNSNGRKSDDAIRERIRTWHALADPATWPGVSCVLCGRPAVDFFGHRDVVLAESVSYRNTTPRGHEGMALCRPCHVCFYALPYGSHLTGGSSVAVHSWDERFLRRAVTRQVDRSLRIAETGDPSRRQTDVREVVALTSLRRYGERVTDGVDLLVYNNFNGKPSLEAHSLEQPLAEWLRMTSRAPKLRRGFTALLLAHATKTDAGVVALARNAFRDPARILGRGVRYLGGLVTTTAPDRERVADLAALLYSFTTEVTLMNEKDLSEIRLTAGRIARLLSEETSGGKLRRFRADLKDSPKLRSWLTSHGVQWAIKPPKGSEGPLATERAFTLLFAPGADNPAWFHRDLLLVGVLEELSRLGWQAKEDADGDKDDEELGAVDQKFITDEAEDKQ
ncbi:hypothetical protein OG883_40685 [Streptomyces sp. NBC_01142]|uniref:hypothetical protein n=1 Tax=Streptomyces sp. NBC_01142 TaxID=2975865 RepID=UPI00225686EB|nr:hypothetical protein [Streptomyces sp. NBC_01142]MCX4825996.1 hypothetical protein [Streptomyces sp. NBC_01142]